MVICYICQITLSKFLFLNTDFKILIRLSQILHRILKKRHFEKYIRKWVVLRGLNEGCKLGELPVVHNFAFCVV